MRREVGPRPHGVMGVDGVGPGTRGPEGAPAVLEGLLVEVGHRMASAGHISPACPDQWLGVTPENGVSLQSRGLGRRRCSLPRPSTRPSFSPWSLEPELPDTGLGGAPRVKCGRLSCLAWPPVSPSQARVSCWLQQVHSPCRPVTWPPDPAWRCTPPTCPQTPQPIRLQEAVKPRAGSCHPSGPARP